MPCQGLPYQGRWQCVSIAGEVGQRITYFFVSDFISPPSAMIFWINGGKGSA